MSAVRRNPAASAALLVAVCAFAGGLIWWEAGGGSIDAPWAPALDVRLAFSLDGLAATYVLLASGVGTAVFAYALRYLPLHLAHDGRPQAEARRFWPWMALFLVAMVGLAMAQDLILLFVFFDLTAICSYLLIGFDRDRREARAAALMALVITGVAAVLLLIGALLLHDEYGTFSIPLLIDRVEPTGTTALAGALIAVAALAKSAQVPLHAWLPRAMAAPTPVSAYLHSAAMVAAGVLVLGRLYPLVAARDVVADGLLVVGLASIAVGGVLALTRDGLKQVLAHSTISQYGYVVVLYGIGGAAGTTAAAFYVVAHGIAKSALFLTAGSVTEATGASELSRLGGLARPLPLLATASGIAAATLAALPLTLGFFKDELFFAAAAERGTWLAIAAVAAAALTFAYVGRFWSAIFLGPLRTPARAVGGLLVWPIVGLAAVAVIGGIVVEPFAALAGEAAGATLGLGAAVPAHPAYHLDLRTENVMALAAWGVGLLALVAPWLWRTGALAVARVGDRVGPARLYDLGLVTLNRLSDRLHDVEVRDLRTRVAAVLLPGGVLVAAGFAATPTAGAFDVGSFTTSDWPLLIMLALAVLATVGVARARTHMRIVLALSVVGFALAAAYEFLGAPDVALVAVLVETVLALVFIGVFALLPEDVLRREARLRTPRSRGTRDVIVAVLSGVAAFAVVWAALSRPSLADRVFERQIELTPSAHGKDVVTVILADFRGLDTLGEITVLAIAIAGVAALLRRGRTA